MPISILSDITLPLPKAPIRVVVKVDRNVLRHIDPFMEPVLDTDGFTRILRKGRPALAKVHQELSTKLFGSYWPRSSASMSWPTYDTPQIRDKWVGFYYEYNVEFGNRDPPVLELKTAEEVVNNAVVFHAVQLDRAGRENANYIINNGEDTDVADTQ